MIKEIDADKVATAIKNIVTSIEKLVGILDKVEKFLPKEGEKTGSYLLRGAGEFLKTGLGFSPVGKYVRGSIF